MACMTMMPSTSTTKAASMPSTMALSELPAAWGVPTACTCCMAAWDPWPHPLRNRLTLPAIPPCYTSRHFDKLPAGQRSQLLDALAGNVPFLASSISKLGPVERASPAVTQHRNALQQYMYFLTWLSSAADLSAASEDKDASKGLLGERSPRGKHRLGQRQPH